MSVDDEDLTLPTDTQRSRLQKRVVRADTTDLSDVDNPDDIATVNEKIEQFRSDHPNGQIKTKVKTFRDPLGIPTYTVTAKVSALAHGYVLSTAHATRTLGYGDVFSANAPLETAESVAIGRALRFMGYPKREKPE